ncbi:GDSL-type esterase/lipase family protein [Streptomyces johnsoniae]|uniref:GDSL-type esterase/lipase family protein n=1 Tax=Streptomyces johnsoniae TaxID=3075532 RepID=A0ABU2SAP5_9ACTN|nr:GDSL-type esterase/lipase family protein [Streptomyces sp. DSM 41886]MDT0444750.1 GDSL-type esterase/lipase family protein [Streptomyces sp. DSM 41886]
MTVPPQAGAPVPVVLCGIRGYGGHHRANLRRLAGEGRVRVVGVCDPAAPADGELDGLGEPAWSADLATLLNERRPAITVVSTPIHTHLDLALTAVRSGSHLLLEKPPAPSLAGFLELAGTLRATGLACQVGFQSFGSRALAAVQELVADDAIGRPHGIGAAGAWVRDARYYVRTPWAGRRRLGTGSGAADAVDVVDGVLTNPLAHAVATALRIDGGDRAEDVAAVELELFRAHDIEADDTSCLRLTTTRGTTVTVAATLCAERNAAPYVVVHGERGRIVLWYTEDRVLLERAGHGPEERVHPRTDLLDNLIAHLRDGDALLSPLERSGAFTRVVEAIRTAPDPARLPPGAWHVKTDGAAPRRVIPGVGALVDASAASLSLFSELGAPWAVRRTQIPPRRRAGGGRTARRTLHLAGDSTAAGKPASAAPMTGWGTALPRFLAQDLAVANHAADGRSSRSFLLERRLDPILRALLPGDLLLVQFGHNDQKTEDASRLTDPFGTYRHCLLRYVRAACDRGARPVLLTPVERRRFDAAGRAVATHGDYPGVVRELAAAEGVPLLDLQAETLALWQRLGPKGSKDAFLWLSPGEHPNHPRGARDDTHFRPHGAAEVARLVARGLCAAGLLAPEDLRGTADPPPLP